MFFFTVLNFSPSINPKRFLFERADPPPGRETCGNVRRRTVGEITGQRPCSKAPPAQMRKSKEIKPIRCTRRDDIRMAQRPEKRDSSKSPNDMKTHCPSH